MIILFRGIYIWYVRMHVGIFGFLYLEVGDGVPSIDSSLAAHGGTSCSMVYAWIWLTSVVDVAGKTMSST